MPQLLNSFEVRSVAIVMLGLMGDVLMRTPLLRELRKAFPNAEITCIVDPIGKELLSLNKNVDALIVTNRKCRSLKYLIEKIKLHWVVFIRRFDVFIDFYGGESSRRLTRTSFSKFWFVISGGNLKTNIQASRKFDFPEVKNSHHLMNQSFDIFRYFDYPDKDSDTTPELHYTLRPTLPTAIAQKLPLSNFYLISLGSGDAKKIINQQMLLGVCKYLHSREKLFPKIICNPGQEFLQRDFADLLDTNDLPNVRMPALHVAGLCRNFKEARFVIAPDSGLFHLALSVNAPVLGIFTHTNPLLVQTDRGLVEFCFKEKRETCKELALPEGSTDLSSRLIIRKAKALLQRAKELNSGAAFGSV